MKGIIGALKKISLGVLISSALFTASLLVFAYIVDENILEKHNRFDIEVIDYLQANANPTLIKAMMIISFFGSSQFLLPSYILLVLFLLWKNKKWLAIDASIIGISSTLIMFLLKGYFKRQRPDSALVKTIVGYSFPSGHSVSSFIFCSILAYLLWKTHLSMYKKYILSFLLLSFTLAIGLSRIVLMVHYASDVIAAYCFAIAFVISSFWLINKLRNAYIHHFVSRNLPAI